MSLDDIMGSWFKGLNDPENPSEKTSDLPLESEVELANQDVGMPEISVYHNIISRSSAYTWLVSALQKEISLTNAGPDPGCTLKTQIRDFYARPTRVSRKSSTQQFQMSFQMNWDFPGFYKEQAYKETLEDVFQWAISLSGSPRDSQATSCVEYVKQTWPWYGLDVFHLIQTATCSQRGIEVTS
jgi:hypothetical protein